MSEEEKSGGGEKSHEASAQKLRKSRERGEVPYSTEATTAAVYAGFFAALIMIVGWCATNLHVILKSFLHKPDIFSDLLLHSEQNGFLSYFLIRVTSSTAPIFLALAATALASIFFQNAFAFSLSKIKPDWSKISIVKNAKQKYGPNGLVEFLKSFAKLSAIIVIIAFCVKDRFFELPGLSGASPKTVGQLLLQEAVLFTGFITIAALGIAAIDLPWKHFQHRNRLKMTHQEVKEENKETDGDPHLKNARRGRAEALATNRMMQDVPKADIVIVNPTHYAVALQWERTKAAAPKCIAKGADEVAAKIREVASTAGVPIRRDPPTARSIHSLVKVGEEIRKEHYAAVAAAIHFADKIQKRKQPWRSS